MLIAEAAPPLHAAGVAEGAASELVARLRALQARMVEAVLDGEGLTRVAELAAAAAGVPVLIAVPALAVTVAPSTGLVTGATGPLQPDRDALGRWAAERIRGRSVAIPHDVLAELPIRFRGELAGFVALLRGDAPPGPDAVEVLHATLMPALMELAVADSREATEQRLRGQFLEELRARRDLEPSEIVRRAARLGCDLSRGAVILCAQLLTDRPRLVETMIVCEHPGALAQRLDLSDAAGARVYAALPASPGANGGPGAQEAAVAAAGRLAQQLARHAIVGVSSFHSDPGELGEAMLEAELVLDVLRRSGARSTGEVADGVYKLLFRMLASHPEEVRAFYEPTIAAVARHDEQYQTGLIETLQAFLDANCNMNATATAIFAHRHTVAYRLRRIHELTGLDPAVSEDRERLGLALKVHRIMTPR